MNSRIVPSGSRVGTLRFRLTGLATVVVALVLMVSAIAVLAVQRRQLVANLDASLQQRADTIARQLDGDRSTAFLNTNDEDRAVQLVALDGHVLAATPNLAGAPALPIEISDTREDSFGTWDDLPLEDDSYRVLSRTVQTTAGPAILHVAENSDDFEEAVLTLAIALAGTIPAVVAILAALIWWLTGRALEPVERMRAQVDSISAAHSGRRVDTSDRTDEISRLGATMNRMLDRLADANERQRRFVADAAHELRTPLTRIRTNLDVDLAHPDTADPAETISTVRQETITLQRLVDDLLHLARSDAGESPRLREPVDLDDIVMQEIRELRTMSQTPTIDATLVSAAHLYANPEHLRRAIRNVLTNAIRHARSSITVALREFDSEIELSVIDDGPGIPAEHRERIFERFARVQDARTVDDGGTGLGLAITRDIVESHGGTIVYEPDHDGACFVIRIPTGHDDLTEA